MKLRVWVLAAVVLGAPPHVGAADPETPGTVPPAVEQSAPPPAAAPVVEKPRPVESPKPAVKPRPVVEPPPPAPAPVTATPEEAPVSAVVPAEPPPGPETEGPAAAIGSGLTVGCGLLAFAMLIIGFAAGFVGRYFWSRRQLGGMTVRIGTWRGVP